MALSTITFLICDGPKPCSKNPQDKCGKVLDTPKKGIHVPSSLVLPKLDSDGSIGGEVVVARGVYCWDCLMKLLDPEKHDPSCNYSVSMRSLNQYVSDSYKD